MTRSDRLSSALLTAYIAAVFTVIPLAMPTGYKDLGEMKCALFLKIAAIFLPLFALLIIAKIIKDKAFRQVNRGLFILTAIFISNLILSAALSGDTSKAWNGSYGWRMGLFAFLTMLASMLFAAAFTLHNDFLYIPLLAGAAAASLIAVANRFGIDLMMPHLSPENRKDFIGTLGNINWFAGFLSVTVPISLSLLFSEKNFIRIAGSLLSLLLFTAAVLQGSNALLPALTAVFLALLILALTDKTYQKPFLVSVIILGAAMEFSCLMTLIFPTAYNGPTDNLFLKIAGFHVGVLLIAVAALLLYLSRKDKLMRPAAAKLLLPTVLALAVILPLLLLGIQLTVTLPRDFGTMRGFIWHVAKAGFKKLPFINMLFGVGPDCMGDYLAGVPGFEELISAVYGNAKLLNAHSMLLTQLLNTGILGVASHLALTAFGLVTGLKSLTAQTKKGSPEHTLLLASLLGVISYEIYMMFSFDQVTVTPLFYVLLGVLYSLNPSRTTVGS